MPAASYVPRRRRGTPGPAVISKASVGRAFAGTFQDPLTCSTRTSPACRSSHDATALTSRCAAAVSHAPTGSQRAPGRSSASSSGARRSPPSAAAAQQDLARVDQRPRLDRAFDPPCERAGAVPQLRRLLEPLLARQAAHLVFERADRESGVPRQRVHDQPHLLLVCRTFDAGARPQRGEGAAAAPRRDRAAVDRCRVADGVDEHPRDLQRRHGPR